MTQREIPDPRTKRCLVHPARRSESGDCFLLARLVTADFAGAQPRQPYSRSAMTPKSGKRQGVLALSATSRFFAKIRPVSSSGIKPETLVPAGLFCPPEIPRIVRRAKQLKERVTHPGGPMGEPGQVALLWIGDGAPGVPGLGLVGALQQLPPQLRGKI